MTKLLKKKSGLIPKKRKTDFLNGFNLYIKEYKRKFLTDRKFEETRAATGGAS